MAKASDPQGIFYQNLMDAGCDQTTISRCVSLLQRKKTADLLRQLSSQRKILLDAVHRNQKQIDCLDYLVYQIEKRTNGGNIHDPL